MHHHHISRFAQETQPRPPVISSENAPFANHNIMQTIQGPHIELSNTENELVQHLKQFCEHLRKSRPDLPSCECRIAGGWVRDKVGGLHSSCAISRNYLTYMQLLGSTTTDMDVSLSSLTGSTF